MITVDKTRKELQDALRFQLELDEAVKAYQAAGYDYSLEPEEYQKYEEAVSKLDRQKEEVASLESLLRGYIR